MFPVKQDRVGCYGCGDGREDDPSGVCCEREVERGGEDEVRWVGGDEDGGS